MEAVFLSLVNRSITAGWLVLAVLALRLLLRRAPKSVLCAMWGLVALRLLCPVSIESPLSLIPSVQTLPETVLTAAQPEIYSGVAVIDRVVNPVLTNTLAAAPGESVNPTQILAAVLPWIWLCGMVVILSYALFTTLRLRRRISTAVRLEQGVKQSEYVKTPFVLGLIHPTIYLPFHMESADAVHVLAHERAHIRRGDPWWKALGFVLLAVCWFHPLMWVAYFFLCRDIEAACDEAVIRSLSREERQGYAEALLRLSMAAPALHGCPLAFGEVGVKARIKGVINYKKPGFWIVTVAVLAAIVVAVCFLTSPAAEKTPEITLPPAENAETVQPQEQPEAPVVEEENEAEQPEEDPLEAAITAAIFQRNEPIFENTTVRTAVFQCFDQQELAFDSDPPQPNQLTLYGNALYLGFSVEDGILHQTEGSNIPVAITFSCEEEGYELVEYWQPGDGTDYAPDIRAKFPAEAAKLALGDQHYLLEQFQLCYAQAVEESGVDPDVAIEAYLQELASEPSTSSNPQDYLEANPVAYRELTYYGAYTVAYCTAQLAQENQNDLRGRLMQILLNELS